MKYKIVFGMIFFGISSISAFEVNTHQAITRCAITTECNKNGAVNLHKFAEDTFFDKKSYVNEKFEGVYENKTYFKYMRKGTGFEAFFIKNKGTTYLDLIEAGVVLEDAVYPHPDHDGDGRFNNHFYAAQFNSKSTCLKLGLINGAIFGVYGMIGGSQLAAHMKSDHALCIGYGNRTDNISWALDKSVNLGHGRVNDYGLDDAFNYYRKSFEGNPESRKKNQAKLFLSLGYMIHLIQDLHSPAHVRDGSHPLGDYLEIYGRYNGGFNLVNGEMNSNNNPLIINAIKNINMKQSMLIDNKYSSYQDFYTHEANWVSNNFMSEAHNDSTKATNNSTGEGLDFDTSTDRDTIFDAYNTHLAKSETREEKIPNSETAVFGDLWNYIKTNGNVASEIGAIQTGHDVVAIVEHGYFFNSERMMAVVDGSGKTGYNDYDKTPLSDTAIHVMPRAVVSSEAFINYFFRGRMKATLSKDENNITIENISDPQWVSSADLCIFKKGMKVDILYIDDKNVSKVLFQTTLSKDVPIGEKYTITGIKQALQSATDIGKEKKIIVLLDGQLGEKRGLDSYGINARGLVVAYASSRVTNADILFSFDKSGSMGSNIELAKSSAKDILDNVVGVDNNSTYIEIEVFNGSAGVLFSYENNVTKAKNSISSIYSGGGTALYDAIKLAGNNAVAHKTSSGISKSIVILYTDGQENSSNASKQQAIDAISKQKASSIDDVFLIHVGNGGGASELQSIAAQADRNYLKVDNVSGLKDAIDKILKGQ